MHGDALLDYLHIDLHLEMYDGSDESVFVKACILRVQLRSRKIVYAVTLD